MSEVAWTSATDPYWNELNKPLDMGRVKQNNRGMDYLAEHDVIRTANRIFGFGKWGTEIVELVELGAVERISDQNKQGWHVGYRCTVRLTVVDCVPVSGVGYGDGVEYTPGARIKACELAVKEAESDAIKRAFKKFGDQFGLILYAKENERRAIAADARPTEPAKLRITEGDRPATQEEINAYLSVANSVDAMTGATALASITTHKGKMEGGVVSAGWLAKCSKALMETRMAKKEEPTPDPVDFTPPDSVATAEAVQEAFKEAA